MRYAKWIAMLVLVIFLSSSVVLLGGCGSMQKPAPKQMNNPGGGASGNQPGYWLLRKSLAWNTGTDRIVS